MKIKVCDKCGAVRTGKVCSRCQEAEVLKTVVQGALAGRELAENHPGLVATMLSDLVESLEDGVMDDELQTMFDSTISDLRQRALSQPPAHNADMMFDIYDEVKKEKRAKDE